MNSPVGSATRRPYDRVKRLGDVVVAASVLVITAPVQLVVAGLVAWKLGRPVLFRQERPGLQNNPFTLVKFRTMRAVDLGAGLVSDLDRITPFGQALRRASLDELPTFWNVLRGDMSLVGPRPLLMQYLACYTPEQARRHSVRPGVTGLAQVSGRNALTWDAKFAADLDYMERRSLHLDTVILGRTILAVIRRAGIAADGFVTMPEFIGSSPDVDPAGTAR